MRRDPFPGDLDELSPVSVFRSGSSAHAIQLRVDGRARISARSKRWIVDRATLARSASRRPAQPSIRPELTKQDGEGFTAVATGRSRTGSATRARARRPVSPQACLVPRAFSGRGGWVRGGPGWLCSRLGWRWRCYVCGDRDGGVTAGIIGVQEPRELDEESPGGFGDPVLGRRSCRSSPSGLMLIVRSGVPSAASTVRVGGGALRLARTVRVVPLRTGTRRNAGAIGVPFRSRAKPVMRCPDRWVCGSLGDGPSLVGWTGGCRRPGVGLLISRGGNTGSGMSVRDRR